MRYHDDPYDHPFGPEVTRRSITAMENAMEKVSELPRGLQSVMSDEKQLDLFNDFRRGSDKIHPSLRIESQYMRQQGAFKITPTVPSTRELERVLSKALQSNQSDSDIENKIRGCNWQDVHEYTQLIRDMDTSKASGSRLHRSLRNAHETAASLNALTSLIPDEKGLGTLRAGLAYVLLAWQRRIKNRESILHLIADVPSMFDNACCNWKMYPNDTELRFAIEDFYSAVIESLTALSQILLHAQTGSYFGRKVKRDPNLESKNIDDASSRISRAQQKLDTRMKHLDRSTLKFVKSNVQQVTANSEINSEHNAKMQGAMQDVQQSLNRIEKGQRQVGLGPMSQPQDLLHMIPEVIQSALYRFECEKEYKRRTPITCTVILSHDQRSPVREKTTSFSYHEVLQLLRVPSSEVCTTEDLKIMLQQTSSMQPDGLARASRLMSKVEFKHLLATDQSGLLLVDGYCMSMGVGRASPLSVFCASLATALTQADSIIVLHFFCGLHTKSDNLTDGPTGMIRCLIVQLLLSLGFNLPELELGAKLCEGLKSDDVDCLCELFKRLVLNLNPDKILFCIIDNISDYETKSWRDWYAMLRKVFRQLYDLVSDAGCPVPFKILMTSGERSTSIVKRVGPGEHVSLQGMLPQSLAPGRLPVTKDDLELNSLLSPRRGRSKTPTRPGTATAAEGRPSWSVDRD